MRWRAYNGPVPLLQLVDCIMFHSVFDRRRVVGLLGAPLLAGALASLHGCASIENAQGTRVAVAGGLILCGVWPQLADSAFASLGMPVQTLVATPQESIVEQFAKGQAYVLLAQVSDEIMALEAQGLAQQAQVWGWAEYVIVGPQADPATVREASSGLDAMQRIAKQAGPFLMLRDAGSHAVVQRLWNGAGILPNRSWLRTDTSALPQAALEQAARQKAYAVVGHIPLQFGQMQADGLELLLQGDPMMRRPYVVLTPGPKHPATPAQRRVARAFADYLLSPQGQDALARANTAAGGTWVFPRESVSAG